MTDSGKVTVEEAQKIVSEHKAWRDSSPDWPTTPNPHDFQFVTFCNGLLEGFNLGIEAAAKIAQEWIDGAERYPNNTVYSLGRKQAAEGIKSAIRALSREKA